MWMGASHPATMLHDLQSILAGERTIFSLRFCEVCTASGDVAIFAVPFGTKPRALSTGSSSPNVIVTALLASSQSNSSSTPQPRKSSNAGSAALSTTGAQHAPVFTQQDANAPHSGPPQALGAA